MNSAPIFLPPLAALALLSAQHKPAAATPGEGAPVDLASVLNPPEFQQVVARLKQLPDLFGQSDQPRRHAHAHTRELGLHMGHLAFHGDLSHEENFSGARGLSSAAEWEQMFPRHALNRFAAR